MSDEDKKTNELPLSGGSLETDEITAHFDRGWDLLNRGDPARARVSADQILQLDPDSPEAYTLLGAIAAAEGDHEEALDSFRRALETDPEYLDAIIYAADVAVHMAADPDLALRLCSDAEELIGDTDPEMLEIGLIRAESHLSIGSFDEARRAVASLPEPPYPEVGYYLRVGRLMLEVERVKPAIELLTHVLESDPLQIEAHYLRGIALETEGRSNEAQKDFLTAEQLNRQQEAPAWSPPAAEFERIVRGVLQQMPPPLGRRLREAMLHVLELPSLELVVEGLDPRTPVYLAGAPVELPEAPKRRRGQPRRKSAARLNGVFIYRRNIESIAPSVDDLSVEIFRALVHEGAFFFGLGDDEYATLLDQSPR